jgi:hypothetical protein
MTLKSRKKRLKIQYYSVALLRNIWSIEFIYFKKNEIRFFSFLGFSKKRRRLNYDVYSLKEAS